MCYLCRGFSEIDFKIDLPQDYFSEVDDKLAQLNSKRPFPKETIDMN